MENVLTNTAEYAYESASLNKMAKEFCRDAKQYIEIRNYDISKELLKFPVRSLQ